MPSSPTGQAGSLQSPPGPCGWAGHLTTLDLQATTHNVGSPAASLLARNLDRQECSMVHCGMKALSLHSWCYGDWGGETRNDGSPFPHVDLQHPL